MAKSVIVYLIATTIQISQCRCCSNVFTGCFFHQTSVILWIPCWPCNSMKQMDCMNIVFYNTRTSMVKRRERIGKCNLILKMTMYLLVVAVRAVELLVAELLR